MTRASSSTTLLYAYDPVRFVRQRLHFHPDSAQIPVLRSSSPRVILNCTRQWGKSTVTAARAVHHAFFNANTLSLAVSPSLRQSAEFLRKASHFLENLSIKPRGDGDNEASLLLPNGSRIVALPSSETTVRGFSAVSLLLIDEAARVPDELYFAVRPMLAASNGHLWLLSTPDGQQGFFYDAWANGGDEWARFRVPATLCPRIPAAFLDEERRTLTEALFKQEYLCEFSDSSCQLFPTHLLEAALTDEVQPLFPGGRSGLFG